MLRGREQKPHRYLRFSLKGCPTAQSGGRSGDWGQIYLDERSRRTENPVLSSRPTLLLVSWHVPQNSLFIMGIPDAASSRKLKRGEVLDTQRLSCLQRVQGTCSFTADS